MINAAALASGDGAELQALLDSVFFSEIEGFSLSAVIATRRGSFALTRAGSAHVPGYVVDESIFPNGASFSLALLNKLHDLDIDFIILAGFAPKLSEGLARAYRGRALMLRSALCPAFDGVPEPELCAAAIRRGVKWTGATVCAPAESGEPGEILLQQPVELLPGDNADKLRRRLVESAGPLLVEAVKSLKLG